MALRRSCGEYSPEEGKDNCVISFRKKYYCRLELEDSERKDFLAKFWGYSSADRYFLGRTVKPFGTSL